MKSAVKEIEKNDPNSQILANFRRLIRAVDNFSSRLRGKYSLNTSLLACLKILLKHGEMSLTELGRLTYLGASTITSAVDRLEEKELLERKRTSADRRVITVSLTKEGVELVKKMPLTIHEKIAFGMQELSEEDKKALNKHLERITSYIITDDYLN